VYGFILAGQILAFLSGAALAQALAWRVLRVELGIHAVVFVVVAIIMLPSHRVPEAIAITCAGAVFGLVANAIVPRLWAGRAGDLIRKLTNALGPDEAETLTAAANAETIPEWSLARVERAFVLLPRFPASPITTIPAWYSNPLAVAFKRLGYESAAQCLPNGNTLITESKCGREFEVTPASEIVWEYICPHNLLDSGELFLSDVFRAYRYPYDWVPQAEPPVERAVVPPANGMFRIAPVDG